MNVTHIDIGMNVALSVTTSIFKEKNVCISHIDTYGIALDPKSQASQKH